MKKLMIVIIGLITVVVTNAQSLEEIIRQYTVANKQEAVSGLKTLRITGNMSMMGMEMPLVMWMKNPNKIKTVTTIEGQEMISVFDGEKGYQVNPMTGSSLPVEMTPEQITQTLNSNVFQNYLMNYFKKGQLELAGEDNVKGKPAYRIKANVEGGTILYLYIDKTSFLLVKTVADIQQEGITVNVESYPSEYIETNGILLPMKTTTSASGMEFVINFTKVEVDLPMDDSVFKIN